jgi:hypothetical protein
MGNTQKSSLEHEVEHPEAASIQVPGNRQSSYEEPNTCINKLAEQGAISRLDTASYVHDMAPELKQLAETAKFSFLAYLLELVIEESAAQKRGRL